MCKRPMPRLRPGDTRGTVLADYSLGAPRGSRSVAAALPSAELQAYVIQAFCEEARRGPESLRPSGLRGRLWPRRRARVGHVRGVSCTPADRPSTDRLFRRLFHRGWARVGVRRPGDSDCPHRSGGEFAPLAAQRSRALTEGELRFLRETRFMSRRCPWGCFGRRPWGHLRGLKRIAGRPCGS